MVGVIGNPTLAQYIGLSAQGLSKWMVKAAAAKDSSKSPPKLAEMIKAPVAGAPGEMERRHLKEGDPRREGWLVTIQFCLVPEDVKRLSIYTHGSRVFRDYHSMGYAAKRITPLFDVALCRTFERMQPKTYGNKKEEGAPFQINAICLPRSPVHNLFFYNYQALFTI